MEEEAEEDEDDNEEDVRNDGLGWVGWGRENWCTGRRWDEGENDAVDVAVAVGCDPTIRNGWIVSGNRKGVRCEDEGRGRMNVSCCSSNEVILKRLSAKVRV